MHDQAGVGEFGDVEGGGDLVGFGVLDGAGPEDDVVGGVLNVGEEVGGEEGVSDEGGGVVVLGGEEDYEEVFEVSFGEVEGLGVAAFVEGYCAVCDAVLFLEFSHEACCCVPWVKRSSSRVP